MARLNYTHITTLTFKEIPKKSMDKFDFNNENFKKLREFINNSFT